MYFDVNSFYVLDYLKSYFKNYNFVDFFGLYNVGLKIIYLNFFLKIFLIFKQHRKFRKVIKRKIKKKLFKNYKYCLKKILINFNIFKTSKKKLNYLNTKKINFFLKKKKNINKFRLKKNKKILDKAYIKKLKNKHSLKDKQILSKKKKFKLAIKHLKKNR